MSVVIACLLFCNAYDTHNYQIYVRTVNSYLLPDDPRSLHTMIVNYRAAQDRKPLLEGVEQTAKDTGSSVTYVTNTIDENGIYQEDLFFYLPSGNTLDVYTVDETASIDFSADDDQMYYTSDETDELRYNLLTSFDHRYFDAHSSIINIYPFCQSSDHPAAETALVFYIHTEDINGFRQTFHAQLEGKSIPYSDDLLDTGENDAMSVISEAAREKIITGLIVALIAYLIAYCLMVNKDRKKIGIYRMEGYSPVTIVRRFYCPVMGISILLYGLATLCCCLLFVSSSRAEHLALYGDLCQYFLLFALGNGLAIIGTWLYLRFTTQYVAIDLHAGLRQILRINYVVKVIVALVLMGGFCQCVKESIPTLRYYQTAVKYRSLVDQTWMLDRVPMVMQTQEFGTKLFEIGYYFNFSDYQYYSLKENPLMYEYFKDQYYEEYYMSEPYLVCNGNYIELMGNDIYDTEGTLVDVHVSSNDYLLVPETYRSLDLKPYSHGSGITEVIYVKHTGNYVDLNMRDPKAPMEDPIIRLKNQWTSSFGVDELLLPNDEIYDKAYYDRLMDQFNVSDQDLAFLNTGYYYDVYLLDLEHSLIDFFYVIALYTFVFGMLLYQSTSAYVTKHQKRMAIGYLNGVPRIKRYRELLLQNVALYLFICGLAIFVMKHTVSDTVLFVSFFGILEFVIQLFMLIRMERRGIADTLKGD